MARVELGIMGGQVNNLPRVCLCCGAPADTTKSQTLNWYPRWVLPTVAILGGGLILMLLTRRMVQLEAPMCRRHRGHWTRQALIGMGTIGGLILLGFVAMALAAAVGEKPGQGNVLAVSILIGWFVVFFGGLIAMARWGRATTIRPMLITDTTLTLVNVSQAFADEVAQRPSLRESRRELDEKPRFTSRPERAADVIRCVCPNCNEEVQFFARVAGFTVRCPECRGDVTVPEA
jgi:hypothetical protein